MCGIAGFWTVAGAHEQDLAERGRRMSDAIAHRGPDKGAVWVDAEAGAVLAQRRLAIVDLSAAGDQPMRSADGRWTIVYNGEIYNAPEIAEDLPGIAWRGHSDTEVLLEACAAWGIEAAVRRCIGMFAFALWDRRERRLHLVRDRFGIKPLYYARRDGVFLFGSELKALRAYPGFAPEVEGAAVARFLQFAYVPEGLSIYRGVSKLPPGHRLTVEAEGETLACWWDVKERAVAGQSQLDRRPEDDVIADLDGLLRDAVGRRMIADVPLGAFLSGGIDSSTVVALMQAQSRVPVRTFSIGFAEKAYDESAHARAVAAHLGTDHTELIVSPEEAREVIPHLAEMFDEPFADSSQIPTFLVSRLARRHVTVSLSGDGGDEAFAGYTRHAAIAALWRRVGRIPPGARRAAAAALRLPTPEAWDAAFAWLPARFKPSHFGGKIHKGADLLALGGVDEMYARVVSQWPEAELPVVGGVAATPDDGLARCLPDVAARLRCRDMQGYLPGDILTKVDRASMAVSLEARVPLLDHRVVEFAWRLPPEMLIRNGVGKYALRRVLDRYVPRHLVERPKIGFGIPVGQWLRGPLRDWAEDLLSPAALDANPFLDAAAVRGAWKRHVSGARNWEHRIWCVLMLQSWMRRWS